MRKFMKSKKGFTLVELLIVVVILGILAAVAIPRFATTRADSQMQACRSNLVAMQSIIEETILNSNILPAAVVDLGTGGIVAARFPSGVVPVCPGGGTYSAAAGKIACTIAGHVI